MYVYKTHIKDKSSQQKHIHSHKVWLGRAQPLVEGPKSSCVEILLNVSFTY